MFWLKMAAWGSSIPIQMQYLVFPIKCFIEYSGHRHNLWCNYNLDFAQTVLRLVNQERNFMILEEFISFRQAQYRYGPRHPMEAN